MKLRTAPFLYKFILVIILAAIFGWLFCYFGIYMPEKKRTQDMLL